jgi:hypothetical protein
MRIALDTDYWDYYDHWFEAPHRPHDIVWARHATGGLSRRDMFAYLASLGLRTPAHGSVRDLANKMLAGYAPDTARNLAETLELVVYTDEMAHAGEGKLKLTLTAALHEYADHLAAIYLPGNFACLGVSLRYLRVGRRQFWLRYASANDWRSNCGEVTIEVLGEEKAAAGAEWSAIALPLYAIDFLPAHGGLSAVDFNTAPGLWGTGIEDRLPAQEVYREIALGLTSALAEAA